jgi:hypothetical protein
VGFDFSAIGVIFMVIFEFIGLNLDYFNLKCLNLGLKDFNLITVKGVFSR